MPRLYLTNSRGRKQLLASNRTPQVKRTQDETYRGKVQKKRKGGAKHSATVPSKARRRQIAARSVTDDESTTSGAESADEGEQDADDADEPEVMAPSRTVGTHEAGRYQYDRSDDNLSEAGETESMFGGSYNPEQDKELEARLLDDDNDDAYQAVDDISESDLDDDRIMEEQARNFLVDVASEDPRDDSEDPSFYLNQIEGMSAYGFGDDSDGTMQFFASSQSSDSGEETRTRHVRFEEAVPELNPFRGFPDSPTMTRALLPSALPNALMHSLTGDSGAQEETEPSEETDSDLTDDDLPDIALHTPKADKLDEDYTPATLSGKKLRPPPVGTFVDDGSQSAGILDSTGTMLLITNPQSLGDEFARRYGESAPPSPGADFAEAVLGTTTNSPDASANLVPDPMFSGLNSRANATANGQTIGIPGAFFPPMEEEDIANFVGPLTGNFDDEGSIYSDMDEGEHVMRIEDIVAFDTDSDDGDSPTSPVITQDIFSSPGLSHLNNGNLTAFRRNADPSFRAMYSSPISNHTAAQVARSHMNRKPKTPKRRKSQTDSPYSDVYYKGVTPVQRVRHPNKDVAMSSPAPAKRRRIL